MANIVFVKKWLNQALSTMAVRSAGAADQAVARAAMLADFRAERHDAFGSSWDVARDSRMSASPGAEKPLAASPLGTEGKRRRAGARIR